MKRRLSCRMMWRSTGLLAYIIAGTWWSGRAHPHHVLLVVEHISAVMKINHFNSAFTSFKTRLIICLIIPFINPFRWTCCMWLYYRHPGIGERRIKNCGAACVVCSVNFRPVWAAKHNSDSNKNQLIRQNETKRNSKQQNKNSIIPFINSSWFFLFRIPPFLSQFNFNLNINGKTDNILSEQKHSSLTQISSCLWELMSISHNSI